MEDRNRKIFQHAAIGMLVLDLNGHILDFNPAASRMMGPERGLIHKRYLGEFFGDKFGQTLPEKLKLLDQLGHLTLEGRLPGRHQAATEVLLDLTQVPWEEDGQAVLVLMHEITARENIERELQLQRRILATGFSARGDAKAPARMLFLVGPKGDAEPFPPEPPGSPLEEIARHFQSPDLLGAVARTLETGRQTLGPLWLDPADPAGDPGRARGLARCLRFDLSSMPGEADRVLAIVEDRTFERLAEEDLRRHDQRAVMSLFSGALFHEFNNYLGVILSQASALRLSTPAGRLVPPSV
ncbi:MAG: PAS domain S-box protein, partial [Planctomycetota bacterium]|nr:PAS domain S-box protein [Planctomycetota bacterium]